MMKGFLTTLVSLWGTPPVVFATVFGIFAFVERIASKEAKESLSSFLTTHSYEPYLGVLPQIIQGSFIRLFGERHLSWKCIIRSFFLSQASLIFTALITVIWAFPSIVAALAKLNEKIDAGKIAADPKTKQIADWIASIGTHKLLIAGIVIWIFWTIVPDYIALLRIRIVLIILRYTNPKMSALIITGIVEFVTGIFMFMTSFAIVQTIVALCYMWITGNTLVHDLQSVVIGLIVFGSFLFGIEAAIFVSTSAIFVTPFIANLFWASMLPSIWLWAYITASLVSRGLMSSALWLRYVVKFLNVREHPIQSVGAVAATALCGGSIVISIVRTVLSL
jgi:hypothetical protein